MSTPIELNCPTCKKTIQWTEAYPHRPFCSHRCQLIDLGEWASEGYSIPVAEGGAGGDIDGNIEGQGSQQ